MKPKNRFPLVFAVCFSLAAFQEGFAAEYVWTGAGDGTTWTSTWNWRIEGDPTIPPSSYPSGTSNTIRFPALGSRQRVTLRDASNAIVGKTVFENSADYEFVNPAGKTAADVMFQPDANDNCLIFGTNATVVLNGVHWSTGKKENFGPATLTLINGAVLEIGSTFTDEFGGTVVVESGSVFSVAGRPIKLAPNEKGEGGLIVVSNATLRTAGIHFTSTNRPGGRVLLQGERPRLFLAYRTGTATEEGIFKDENGDGKIVFDVPLWGYDHWVPFLSAASHGTSLTSGSKSPAFAIAPESEVFRADFCDVLPLVSTPIASAGMSSLVFPRLEVPSLPRGLHFEWRFSTAAMPGENDPESAGVISDYAWSKTVDASAPTTFIGGYIKVQYGTLFLFR